MSISRLIAYFITIPVHTAGRLVRVSTETDEWGWGVLVAFRKLGLTPGKEESPLIGKNEPSQLVAVDQNYVLDVLLGVTVDEMGMRVYDKEDLKGESKSAL